MSRGCVPKSFIFYMLYNCGSQFYKDIAIAALGFEQVCNNVMSISFKVT